MPGYRVGVEIGTTPLGTVDANGFAASLPIATGQSTAFTTLNAATGDTTGTAMDCGVSRQVLRLVCVGTSTLAGTLTVEGSVDNVSWISTGTTVALTAAATVTTANTSAAFRYYRVSLSGSSGAGTATCKIMAGG